MGGQLRHPAAQVRNQLPDLVHGGLGAAVVPDRVDQAGGLDQPAAVQQQPGQQPLLGKAAHGQGPGAVAALEGAENGETQRGFPVPDVHIHIRLPRRAPRERQSPSYTTEQRLVHA